MDMMGGEDPLPARAVRQMSRPSRMISPAEIYRSRVTRNGIDE